MEGGRVAETGAVSWVLERQARLRKEHPLSTSPQFLPSSLFNSQVFLRFVFWFVLWILIPLPPLGWALIGPTLRF